VEVEVEIEAREEEEEEEKNEGRVKKAHRPPTRIAGSESLRHPGAEHFPC
jgi:hypothetical protein